MSPWLRRCALCLLVFSLPAVAAPRHEDRRVARIRSSSPRPEAVEAEPAEAEAAPLAASTAEPGGVDLAGLLGMLTAIAATYVYARSQRPSPARVRVDGPAGPPPS